MSRVTSTGRRGLLLAALAALVALLAATGLSTTANAVSNTVASLKIASVTGTAAPANTPPGAVPPVIVQVGQAVTVTVSFYDSTGAPAAFSGKTTLAVTSSVGDSTTASVPAGVTSTTIPLTMKTAANQVTVSVAATGSDAKKITGDTWATAFDVQQLVNYRAAQPTSFQQGIGGKNNDCGEVTAQNPVCGLVVLPNGANGTQILLSLGQCDGFSSTYAACDPKGSVVQLLADLGSGSGSLYSLTSPATLILKCDKTLCGTGGIQTNAVYFTFSGSGPVDQPAGACPAKNTLGDGQGMCVDWVQSKRDNAGDSLLYVLFAQDAKIITGH